MELFTSATSAYLLEASLDVLHFESKEWLEELAFMKDETRFLDKLLEQNTAQFSGNSGHYPSVHQQVRLLRHQRINELVNDLITHEKYLAGLLTTQIISQDSEWRQAHRYIKTRLEQFRADYQALKKQVFRLIESL